MAEDRICSRCGGVDEFVYEITGSRFTTAPPATYRVPVPTSFTAPTRRPWTTPENNFTGGGP